MKEAKTNMLLGEVKHQLDAKNRVRIPPEFKKELGEKLAFVCGPNCIRVYPAETIENEIASLNSKINPYDDEEMEAFRDYTSTIKFVTPDPQGRILVPKFLLENAKIEKNVKTVGAYDHLDILADNKTEEETKANLAKSRKILAQVFAR